MSNKRINLTQFTGITPGPWKWDDGILCNDEATHPDYGTKGVDVLETFFFEATNEDANAIAKVPDLIAELKRCYEELDKWTNYATYIENVDMDCHKDASAEAGFLWKCTDCGAHFELPKNGIYKCEFGCDASE